MSEDGRLKIKNIFKSIFTELEQFIMDWFTNTRQIRLTVPPIML